MKCVFLAQQIHHYHEARFRAVSERGLELFVLVSRNSADLLESLSDSSGENYDIVRLYQSAEEYLSACRSGRIWERVKSCLDRLDPDVIAVAGWASPESFAAISWAKSRRRGIVILSDSQREDASRNPLKECIKRLVLWNCDAALVAGKSHKDYLSELGMPGCRTFVGYDVVDNKYFSEGAAAARSDAVALRQTWRLPDKYILAVGRLIPKKNYIALVDAFAAIQSDLSEVWGLVLVGDGPERDSIHEAVRLRGLTDNVVLLGAQDYRSLPVLYGLASGFCHVPKIEQWGLVINEAAASGLPIIATSACGACKELVSDNQNGFVVRSSTANEIAVSILRLALLSVDERAEMGRRSAELVSDWGLAAFCDGLFAAICEATENKRDKRLLLLVEPLLRILASLKINSVS